MGEVEEERGSSRISAPETGGHPGRQANGQFLPGHTLPGAGRKPKAVERAYLEAIRDALPPEQMQGVIAEALQLARDTRSWRGLLEVVQFAASYGAGKPTQKTVTTDGNLEQLLAALSNDAPLLPVAAGVAVVAGDE